MDFYPRSAVERAMKIQEVILRALAKKITWWQAAEIIGVGERTMRRWKEEYDEHGYDGLFDRRPRRPLPGMLLHLDGSRHRWFQDDRWYDLLVILDDATSEVHYAHLVEEESTRTLLEALRQVVEQQGVSCALYTDRASHFFETPERGSPWITGG